MKYYQDLLQSMEADKNLRHLPRHVCDNTINLSSNDYLGLLSQKELWREFEATYKPSTPLMSCCSSRLLTGNSLHHIELEAQLEALYQKDGALVFNSGYHANMGILPALTSKNDLIVADKSIHASIIDGMRLSDAESLRFNHNDCGQLEKILEKRRHQYRHVFIVTESIFSMDGDFARLKELVELKNRFDCYLYVDEAHAFGVRGERGLGLCEELEIIDDVELIIGTFGKAVASMGAFVVCGNLMKSMLVNRCRPFIFSTALPPINCAWTRFIINKLPMMRQQRNQLKESSDFLAQLLNAQSQSHIVPYVVGSNEMAVSLSEHLRHNGFHVLPIRHPTVPKGQARLRFSLSSQLTLHQLSPLKTLIDEYSMD